MKSPSLTRALPLIALVIASLAAFAPGCGSDDTPGKKNPGGSGGTGGTGGTGGDPGCTSNDECPTGEECVESACQPIVCDTDADCPDDTHCPDSPAEGETVRTCQVNCFIDADCGFDNGLRCDDTEGSETLGRCIVGETCNMDANCGSSPDFDYCEIGECVCIPDTSAAPLAGVCRRTTPTCSPCRADADCGTDPFTHKEPGNCVSYNVDGTDADVCLPLRLSGGRCPRGTVPDESGDPALADYCVPQYGDCADMNPCRTDNDCEDNPSAPICDQVSGICIAACRFDFETNKTQNCPPAQVCHTTAAFLDPQLLNECATVGFFGQGKCGTACVEDADCAQYDNGTGTFVCAQEGSGDSPERRCRPKSEVEPGTIACLNDRECPVGEGGLYLGYCDLKDDPTQNECVYDNCRTGQDPRAGCGNPAPYADCTPDYKCVETDVLGVGECIEKDCIDLGGAAVACRKGEYCSGEPPRSLLTGEIVGSPPQVGVPSGECYAMDTAAWCEFGCESNDDCTNVPTGVNAYPDSPGLCFKNADEVARCHWGCELQGDCPGRWSCSSAGLEVNCGQFAGQGLQACTSDAQCGGTNKCVAPIVRGQTYSTWGKMVSFGVCECSATDACGPGYECNAGLGTAGQDPANPETFQVRQARYCAVADVCGANGSCEWFGDSYSEDPMDDNAPVHPIFRCGATAEGSVFPGEGATPIDVQCPETNADGMPVRKGKAGGDQHLCVASSICVPALYQDESEAWICGVEPAP